ncbi:serine/threonine-protein kinase [Streptomyces sp. SM14]|uniref:serine/threonine-protein kinase n=1 Tax=Streptomyces sp. SM14 TaxID=1736045 RepID=UPI000CD4E5D0|nr:serine/threonine-protein kinase [Streptomyces sp. SM14]
MQRLTPEDPAEVGGYRLLGGLGEGGMGRVYLARTPGGRALALKTIRTEHTRDPGFRERFEREIRNSDRVRSAWTVPVVDWSRDPHGRQWLASEYVAAPSLHEWVDAHGPFSGEALAVLGRELARALAAVGESGLLHRDLKPSNVLLGPVRPLLIDFGIAHAVDESRFTATGGVIGSPGYLSPEQASGSSELTPASDVFALAALLYFAATGHGPFLAPGESASVPALLYRVVHQDPDLDRLPAELREPLGDAFAKDPGARPEPAALAARFAALCPPGPGGGWAGSLPAPLRAEHERRTAEVDEAVRLSHPSGPVPGAPSVAPYGPPHGHVPPPVGTPYGLPGPGQHSPSSPYPASPAPLAPPPSGPPERDRRRGPKFVAVVMVSLFAFVLVGSLALSALADLLDSALEDGEADGTASGGAGGAGRAGGAGDDDAASDDGNPDAMPESWAGTWYGEGSGTVLTNGPFAVTLALVTGEVGDLVGWQSSEVNEVITERNVGCTEELELVRVDADSLVLEAVAAEPTDDTVSDVNCGTGNVYTVTMDPDDPDVMLLAADGSQDSGAPDTLDRTD